MNILIGKSLPIVNISSEAQLKIICNSMFNKYPKNQPSILQILNKDITQWPKQAPQIISQQDLSNGIINLAITANGATGWGSAIIKQVFSSSETARTAFHYIICNIASNIIPDNNKKILTSMILIPLSKNNGSIRPISIGDIWMRLTGLILLGNINTYIPDLLPT